MTTSASRFSAIRSVEIGPRRLLFISGLTAGDECPFDIESQTRIIFGRMQSLLQEHGASLSDLMKITAFLTDIRDYAEYNAVRNEIFNDIEPPPASTGVEARLSASWKRIEIDGIAIVG